ncbi:MAG: ATP-binding protein [Pseudomonadota bacterium]
MPFKALPEKHFVNREREIDRLKDLVDLKENALVGNIILQGDRGIGKTELLKQFYRILFREEKNTLPFYYSFQRATLKAASFAKDYFSRFMRQFLAFLHHDPSIVENVSIPLIRLMPLASSMGLGWLIDLMEDFQDQIKTGDPHEQILAAISAPVLAARESGISVLVMLDNFQLATHLYILKPDDAPGLMSLFEGSMRSPMTPHIFTGSPPGLLESLFGSESFKGMVERLRIRPFQEDEAFTLFKSYCFHLGITTLDETRRLMKFLGGNPLYLRNMAGAHGRMKKREVTVRGFWECYSHEVSEGETAFYWSGVFGRLLSDPDKRGVVLRVLMHGMGSPSGTGDSKRYRTFHDTGRLSRSLGLTEPSLRMILKALQNLGIILPAGGFKPIEDNVLRDFIKSLYMREVEGEELQTVRRMIEEKYIEPTGSSSIEMTLPMETNAELVAAKAVEQICKNRGIGQEIVSQLQLALIEAFINAKEHSGSYEKKVSIRFNTYPEKIEMIVESPGKVFAIKTTEGPDSKEESPPARKRGMGFKLMREVMDDVRVEVIDNGTRVILTKGIP